MRMIKIQDQPQQKVFETWPQSTAEHDGMHLSSSYTRKHK
jgi:hypothetical protein